MKETYYLNQSQLPCIPNPHDCVIREVRMEGADLIFVFEEDISYHNSIIYTRPEAKSLIITYHLLSDIYDISMFVRKKPNRLLHRSGDYREIPCEQAAQKLAKLTAHDLQYLYHTVGYCNIILQLWSRSSVVLDLAASSVDYEWITP